MGLERKVWEVLLQGLLLELKAHLHRTWGRSNVSKMQKIVGKKRAIQISEEIFFNTLWIRHGKYGGK